MVRADDTVKTADDLKGRNVGVSTVGSVTSWIVSEVSRQRGWGFDGIVQVPIGDDAARIAALQAPSRSMQRSSTSPPRLKFVQRGEGPYPASLRRSHEGLSRPRHLRHRQDHRGEARHDSATSSRAGSTPSPSCTATNPRRSVSPRASWAPTKQTTAQHLRRADADVLRHRAIRAKGAGGAEPLVRRNEDTAARARYERASTRKHFCRTTDHRNPGIEWQAMSKLRLTIACGAYDIVKPLMEGDGRGRRPRPRVPHRHGPARAALADGPQA